MHLRKFIIASSCFSCTSPHPRIPTGEYRAAPDRIIFIAPSLPIEAVGEPEAKMDAKRFNILK